MNCRIMGNWAKHMGGGIYASGTGINIQDCIVASNTSSGADGGIAGGEVISNNYASIHTGGIYCDLTETNVLISGCTIVNNRNATGANGGLLVLESQKVVIRNCLMANNSGTLAGWSDRGTSGGGLCVPTSTTNGLIENCTIASNRINQTGSVVGYGAGLYVDGGVRVVNSIVYQNIYTGGAGTSSNVYVSEDCVFNNSCTAPLTGLTGTSNTDADPQFVSKETGNFRLKGGSPCINAGLYSAWMQGTVDLDGSRRISGSQVDIGAFEYIFKGTFIRVW